ncbi:MAG: FG-GAP repeat protein, partial [Planctomycetota bacterium]
MSALSKNLTLTRDAPRARRILPLFVLAALALVLIASAVNGQCQVEKLMAPGHDAFDDVGAAVAVEGDYAVMADRCGVGTGEVFAFTRTAFGWVNTEVLFPSDPCDAQEYGYSVAMSGKTLLVGAPSDDDIGGGAGAVYVYFRDERGTAD